MAEDKDEGEVQGTSSGASVEEGDFSSGLDNQISTIEEQLQRAEATLFDLQSLRGKLEAERQKNLHRAQEEKELQEALDIKKENDRLRKELKEYHGEIGSLKEIISSLKDDLVKTAEKLETKVNKTLHSIGEGDISDVHERTKHNHTQRKVAHKSHADKPKAEENRNFFSDHLDPKADQQTHPVSAPDIKEEKAEPMPVAMEPATAESVKPELVEPPSVSHEVETNEEGTAADSFSAAQNVNAGSTNVDSPTITTETPPAPVQEAAAEAPVETIAQPAVTTSQQPNTTAPAIQAEPASGSIVDQFLGETANTNPVQPVVITNIKDSVQTAEDLVDDDFDEYEEIKRELEALEQESLFKVQPPATVSQPVPAPQEPKKSGDKKSLISLFSRKKQSAKALVESAPDNPAPVVQEAAETSSSATESNISSTEPAVPTSDKSSEPISKEEVASETNQQPLAQLEPAKTEQDSEPIAAKPKASLANIFKRKKKKIRGEVKDGRDGQPDDHIRRGGGKLAISAAVIILLAVLTGFAYKIKNAENLRQTYISKATESVAIANLNDNKSETPDEFLNSDPAVKYKEAFVDLPFDETAWATHTDPDMGITIEYPKNTSYRLKPVGSNNLWFLRKEGYLMKIEKLDGAQSLGEVRDGIMATGVKYNAETVVVRGNTTIHLALQDDLPVKGNIYLTSVRGSTYKIWYKTFAPGENPDDGQRVQKMLDSLDFIAGS